MTGYSEHSDDELMSMIAGGESAALDMLFLRHKNRVFNLAYRHLSSVPEAEDITQETFLRVLGSAGKYKGEGRFRTWLLTIAGRLCLKKKARHSGWREYLVGLFHPDMEKSGEMNRSPEEKYLEDEKAMIVQQALGKLPPDQRMALLLARFEDLSYEEISDVMGKSVQSVTSLIWRGRSGLEKKLEKVFMAEEKKISDHDDK